MAARWNGASKVELLRKVLAFPHLVRNKEATKTENRHPNPWWYQTSLQPLRLRSL
jgi:hypothetical protein